MEHVRDLPDGKKRAWWMPPFAAEYAAHTPGVPNHLRATLIMLALFSADEYGRGMFPAWSTLAHLTGKSPSKVYRDLRELEGLGIIIRQPESAPGQPRGRSTIVYNLASAPVKEPEPPKLAAKPKVATEPKSVKGPEWGLGPFSTSQFRKLEDAVRGGHIPTDQEIKRSDAKQRARLDEAESYSIAHDNGNSIARDRE